MENRYYHLFANGDDAKNFITSEAEFKQAFNRFAICSIATGVRVVSCSVEDSHPHALLYGCYENCYRFKELYQDLSTRSIVQNRGMLDGVCLHCEIDEVGDEQYLMNVAAYTIVQATKDGKPVMPYDYRFGTGALYFRNKYAVLPWLVNDDGKVCEPIAIASLTVREKRKLYPSSVTLPGDWLVCNGFILPTNYIDITRFESIYRTHNCYRVFLCAPKTRDDVIRQRMQFVRGVVVEDLEARRLCESVCLEMFGQRTTRCLSITQRMELATSLRRKYSLAYRQLSFLTRIPESELRKYVK